jgi:hypothetical protein
MGEGPGPGGCRGWLGESTPAHTLQKGVGRGSRDATYVQQRATKKAIMLLGNV